MTPTGTPPDNTWPPAPDTRRGSPIPDLVATQRRRAPPSPRLPAGQSAQRLTSSPTSLPGLTQRQARLRCKGLTQGVSCPHKSSDNPAALYGLTGLSRGLILEGLWPRLAGR